MKIIKSEEHVLLRNNKGEYHLTHELFEQMGEEAAIQLATNEIAKKSAVRKYTGKSIDFSRARALGFCEYGIKDFCDKLKLDVNKEYEIKHLNSLLNGDIIGSYFDECLKLFGKGIFNKWGGPVGYLKETKSVNPVLRVEFIPEHELHELACKFAERVLPNFEKQFPGDDRPRKAIEAKRLWLGGVVPESAAWSAAESARSAAWSARSAAWSAAESAAGSAARSAAWSAAESARSAARSAAWSAARSAAWSAERDWQVEQVIEVLERLR